MSEFGASMTECSKGRLVVDCTQDCSQINAENLQKYDAVLFYTTGELPISADGRAALIEFVRGGGGFIGYGGGEGARSYAIG